MCFRQQSHYIKTAEDITEQKKYINDIKEAERKLFNSRERYRKIVDFQTDAVCRWMPDTTLTFVNEGYAKIFGKSIKEMLGKKWIDFVPKNTHNYILEKIDDILNLKKEIIYDHQTIGADGNIYWQHWIDCPILDENDNVVEIQSVGRDITDIKKHEFELQTKNELLNEINKRLSESEEKYRILFDNMPIGVGAAELNGTIIDGNKAILDMLGFESKESALGKNAADFYLDADERLKLVERFKRDNQILNYETKLRKKTGNIFDAKINLIPIVFHNENLILTILEDITSRNKMLNKLKEFENIINRSPVMVFLWNFDENFSVQYVSDNVAQLGYTSEDFYANKSLWLDITHPEDRPRLENEVKNYIKTDTLEFSQKYRIITKSGEIRWLEDNTRAIKNANGEIQSFQGIILDTTDKVNAENEAKSKQLMLLQTTKMAALGQLVSGVAHEINNPNNFLSINIPVLKQYWLNIKPIFLDYIENQKAEFLGNISYIEMVDDIENLIDELQDGSNRIKKIVANLKEFSQQSEIEFKPVAISEIINKSFTIIKSSLTSKVKNIEFSISDNLPLLNADAYKLSQVIINILNNAAESLEDKENSRILIKAESFKDNIKISISDNGVGIEADKLKNIMEPFFTTKLSTGGTGLGLSIIYGIVKEHNGVINVLSDYGFGTNAIILLPAAENKIEEKSSEILMFDDDKIFCGKCVNEFIKDGLIITTVDKFENLKKCFEMSNLIDTLIVNIDLLDYDKIREFEKLKNENQWVNIRGQVD